MKKYEYVIMTTNNSPIIKGELLALNAEEAWEKAIVKLNEYKIQSNNPQLKLYVRFD